MSILRGPFDLGHSQHRAGRARRACKTLLDREPAAGGRRHPQPRQPERGTTVCDFDPQEQAAAPLSLDAALVHLPVSATVTSICSIRRATRISPDAP